MIIHMDGPLRARSVEGPDVLVAGRRGSDHLGGYYYYYYFFYYFYYY